MKLFSAFDTYASSYVVITAISLFLLLFFSHARADEVSAADVDEYEVLERGSTEIKIDAEFDEWGLAKNVLIMGEDTWEALGGSWDDDEDLTAELRIVYDTDNLYFALLVKDSEYVAEAGTPWQQVLHLIRTFTIFPLMMDGRKKTELSWAMRRSRWCAMMIRKRPVLSGVWTPRYLTRVSNWKAERRSPLL